MRDVREAVQHARNVVMQLRYGDTPPAAGDDTLCLEEFDASADEARWYIPFNYVVTVNRVYRRIILDAQDGSVLQVQHYRMDGWVDLCSAKKGKRGYIKD